MSKAENVPPAKPGAARNMSEGQRRYEERRAGKAGLTLDKHLAAKERRAAEDDRKLATPPAPKKKGLLGRLLDRAHKPI